MSPIAVRQAALVDLDELAVLFDRYRQFQGRPSDLRAAREFLQARFEQGDSVVFLAFDALAPIGFAQLYPSYSSVALARIFVLNDLFVDEAGRRKGVASKLLEAVERHAASLGAARVSLNVAKDNQPGLALYEARGWQRDAQFHMYHHYPDRSPQG